MKHLNIMPSYLNLLKLASVLGEMKTPYKG